MAEELKCSFHHEGQQLKEKDKRIHLTTQECRGYK